MAILDSNDQLEFDWGDVDKVTEKIINPLDKMYPHKCPRCGDAAYVGFNEVLHKDTDKDKMCK